MESANFGIAVKLAGVPSLSAYLWFCIGALALIASPGADFFYVATRGLAGGPRAGIASALGIGAGLLVHTTLAASGLTLLLLASNWVFNVIKWLGALYLIWMGVKILRSGDELLAATDVAPLGFGRLVRQGVLTNVFNPKVALTFAAFLPQFVDLKQRNPSLQMAVLGASMCVLATSWFCRRRHFRRTSWAPSCCDSRPLRRGVAHPNRRGRLCYAYWARDWHWLPRG